ncbi:hypothetical protein CapIbe_012111 [Capra ibex]
MTWLLCVMHQKHSSAVIATLCSSGSARQQSTPSVHFLLQTLPKEHETVLLTTGIVLCGSSQILNEHVLLLVNKSELSESHKELFENKED